LTNKINIRKIKKNYVKKIDGGINKKKYFIVLHIWLCE